MTTTIKVLFIDDDADLLAGVKLGLRKAKFEVFTATSANDAAAVLRQHDVDVVVSDEQMPEVTGSRFLGFVRRNFPRTVRIVLTGQASLDAVRRAVNEAGISRLLIKPCGAEDLAAAITESVRERDEASAAVRDAAVFPS